MQRDAARMYGTSRSEEGRGPVLTLKRLRIPIIISSATALVTAVGVSSASAMDYAYCDSPNNITVEYTFGGVPNQECFSGTGGLEVNIPDVAWVRAGEYETWALIKDNSGGYYGTWISPEHLYVFGSGTLVDLSTS